MISAIKTINLLIIVIINNILFNKLLVIYDMLYA